MAIYSDLEGKVVLVTGAARGIGKAISEEFARQGSIVIMTDLKHQEELLKKNDEEFEKKYAAFVRYIAGDVTNKEDVKNVASASHMMVGKGFDILVNNAGIIADNIFLRMKEEEWDRVLNVNLYGTKNFCQAVLPQMLKQKKGSIINIASVIGLYGNTGQANYAASKAGIIALTKSIAKEYGSRGIRANAIAPGYIETAMSHQIPEKTKATYG